MKAMGRELKWQALACCMYPRIECVKPNDLFCHTSVVGGYPK